MTFKDATDTLRSPQGHERKSEPDIKDGESVNKVGSYECVSSNMSMTNYYYAY